MSFEAMKDLAFNASLLLILGLVLVYVSTARLFANAKTKALAGMLNGLVCLFAIMEPVSLSSGLSADPSFILLTATSMFFGLESALVNLLVVVAGRLFLGGSAALTGIVIADFCVAAGLVWNRHRLQACMDRKEKPWIEFIGMGVICASVQNISLTVVPPSMPLNITLSESLATLVVYTLGSLFLSIMTLNCLQTLRMKKSLTDALCESEVENMKLTQQVESRDGLLRSLFDSISDLAFFKDTSSIYLDCNAAFETFTRRQRQEIIGLTDYDLFAINAAVRHVDADREVLALGEPRVYEEMLANMDGEEIVLETMNTPCFNKDGEIIGLIGISRDITERKKKEEEIRYLTYHDVSTGLFNTNYMDLMRSAYGQSPPFPLSVVMCDLNGLKLINDAFGHDEGTKLLREAAGLLKKCARPTDIIARIGGDEFCVLLPDTEFAEVQSIVERIETACREFKGTDDCPYAVNLAIGYATGVGPGDSVDQIFKTAEDFMNKKKMLDLQSFHNSILSSIKTTMYEKSLETEEHAERLAMLSETLGRQLGLKDQELIELKLFAMLHDIGKIGIDERILRKKEKLTEDDWLEIRKHPEIGYRITHATADLKTISDYILYHHERWDGRGYPLGLSGSEIPLLSRVLSVVDSYDAMTNDRVYRKALSESEAVAEIVRNSGSQFDPNISEVFVQIILDASAFSRCAEAL